MHSHRDERASKAAQGESSEPRNNTRGGEPRRARRTERGRAERKGNRRKNAGRGHHQVQAMRRTPAPLPHITYPEQLPVSARREEIRDAIIANQVVVIAGETGSGKTTQLPKICLEAGRGKAGMIGHTQPRRIAARSVAERICAELGTHLGEAIGYQVRFTEEVSENTLVKLMTDGILLAEIQHDPLLLRYDTLIIDEAHERSLNIDFLLGYLAQLLPQRPDLKLIITSATIDTERFAEHFGHYSVTSAGKSVPIIEVSGRTYPVEIRYRPLDEIEEGTGRRDRNATRDLVTGIIDAAGELEAEGEGDILVFLSGEGEIRDVQQAFAEELGPRYIQPGGKSGVPRAVEVLPLFARLSAAEQHRIFESHSHRRIILATNIAETSLTVPGIRYVIDPGTARISRYSNKTKVQRLPIEEVSQASANQRAGRCGRVADGICIRLYSEENFNAREEFTQPEILRTSLAAVILQMLNLGLGNITGFPFIDPPEERAVRAGMQLLEEIGALRPASPSRRRNAQGGATPQRELSRIGHQLARLPIDPRLGRMLIEAQEHGCASDVLVLVAALSVQDVRERPVEYQAQADQLHARFTTPSSDFLAYLNLWRYLRTQQRELSGSALRKMCRAEFLNYVRFREWMDVVHQLEQLARPLHLDVRPLALPSRNDIARAREGADQRLGATPDSSAIARACQSLTASAKTPEVSAIHRSLLIGLLSNIGNYTEKTRDYLGARGTHFRLWPGSGLYRRNPSWVMAAELVETSALFARSVAAIEPEWIEPLAKNLVKRSYSEPYWSRRNGAAMCKERVTLYGITLVADRPKLLSSIGTASARELAREMFIRHALVEGDWRTHHHFLDENARLLEEAAGLEDKLRKRGIVADEDRLVAFYDERVGENVTSARHFDSWWKNAKQHDPQLLTFTQELLLGDATASPDAFPDEWEQNGLRLALSYSYNPGGYGDGIIATVPVSLLPQLQDVGFDWLVPGMRLELVTATIRALPKPVRRQLVPAPDVARGLLQDLEALHRTGTSFRDAFTSVVRTRHNVEVRDTDWQQCHLPSHLQMWFRVCSESGAVLDEGSNLSLLQTELAPRAKKAVESVVKGAISLALDEARRNLLAQATPEPALPPKADHPELRAAVHEALRDAAQEDAGEILTTWPPQLPHLATHVETPGPHGMTVRAYPAFQVPGRPQIGSESIAASTGFGAGDVRLGVAADIDHQIWEHTRGIIHLLCRDLALPEGRITSRWNSSLSLALASTPYPSTSALVADLQLAATRFLAQEWAQRTGQPLGELRAREQWEALRIHVRDHLEDRIFALAQLTGEIATLWRELRTQLKASTSFALLACCSDIDAHIKHLLPAGFLASCTETHMAQLPRYVRAAIMRLSKAEQNPAADDTAAWQVSTITDAYREAVASAEAQAFHLGRHELLIQAAWMIEELRVSLFAQQLGTVGKVSVKRIQKVLDQARALE